MPNSASNRHQTGIPTLCSFILGNEVAEETLGLLPLSVPDGIYLRIVKHLRPKLQECPQVRFSP